MNIKKSMALSLAAMITISPLAAKAEKMNMIPISAPIENTEEEAKVFEYIEFRGKIVEVQSEGDSFYIVAENDSEEGLNALRANINKDVILLNDKTMEFTEKEDIVVGTEVTIFYHKETLMGLSQPPLLNPNVVVINEAEAMSTIVSKFDKEFLNAEKDLYARPSDKTVIIDKEGNNLTEEEIGNRDWIIFYDIVLTSYPGQTSPKKIIVMPEKEELPASNEFLLRNDFIKEIEGVKMIPLRLVGEGLGYEVSWNQESKAVELARGAQWTAVTIGQDNYNFAKMLVKLGAAPVLIEEKTYVPMNFIEEILKSDVEASPEGLKIIY